MPSPLAMEGEFRGSIRKPSWAVLTILEYHLAGGIDWPSSETPAQNLLQEPTFQFDPALFTPVETSREYSD